MPCICTKQPLLFPRLLFLPCCLALRAFTVPLWAVLQPPLRTQLPTPGPAAGTGQPAVPAPRAPGIPRGSVTEHWPRGPAPGKAGTAWAWRLCCCPCLPGTSPHQHKREGDLAEEVPMGEMIVPGALCHAQSHPALSPSALQTTLPDPYLLLPGLHVVKSTAKSASSTSHHHTSHHPPPCLGSLGWQTSGRGLSSPRHLYHSNSHREDLI